MTMQSKLFLLLGGGSLSLLASAAALVGMQVCLVQNFWLHAMAFPINPQTVAQPTALTYIGVACEIACPVLLLCGVVLSLSGVHSIVRTYRGRS